MFASEEPSRWNKAAEISTWILLFFVLIPGTTLAYFAETSLPNTPLYPIKRNIESVTLALSSINTSAKTFYQINLARIRLQETQQIVTSQQGVTNQDLSQFNTVMAQIAAANESIDTVNDPSQKTQMKQQLHQTTSAYRKQLARIQEQLQGTPDKSTGTFDYPLPNQLNSQSSTQNSQDSTTSTSDTTNTPNVSNLSSDDKTTLEQTIQTISDQLDTVDAATNTPDTSGSTPDTNTSDTPTSEPIPPTLTPTPTPTWWDLHHTDYHGNTTNQSSDHSNSNNENN